MTAFKQFENGTPKTICLPNEVLKDHSIQKVEINPMSNTMIAVMQLLPISVFSFEFQIFVLPFHNCLLSSDITGSIGHRAVRMSVIASTAVYLAVFLVLAGFFDYVTTHHGLPDKWPTQSIPLLITIIVNFTARIPALFLVSLFILQALF